MFYQKCLSLNIRIPDNMARCSHCERFTGIETRCRKERAFSFFSYSIQATFFEYNAGLNDGSIEMFSYSLFPFLGYVSNDKSPADISNASHFGTMWAKHRLNQMILLWVSQGRKKNTNYCLRCFHT